MGDYNTLIVSARINLNGMTAENLESEIRSRLPLCDSAYHATAPFLSIEADGTISMITQAKYNRGVYEFLDWLRPMVGKGLGGGGAWAINFSEYSKELSIEYLRPDWTYE